MGYSENVLMFVTRRGKFLKFPLIVKRVPRCIIKLFNHMVHVDVNIEIFIKSKVQKAVLWCKSIE